jgi:hypothetical protein
MVKSVPNKHILFNPVSVVKKKCGEFGEGQSLVMYM